MIVTSNFTVKGIYNNVKAVIMVDCEHKEADIMMMVDHKIHNQQKLTYRDVDTAEKAKAWLSKDMGKYGTFLEYYHTLYGRDFNNGIKVH